jgi:F-type H+-transporting ATPase subunit b
VSELRPATLLVLGLVLAPRLASAADEGGGAASMLWHALNFALLVGLLVYFGRQPIQRFMAERRREIEGEIHSAADLLARTEGRLAEWQRRVDGLDVEVAEIRRQAQEAADADRARILADAEASAERIRRDAAVAADREIERARGALRAEAAELAMEVAARLVRENITDADRSRLVDEFVERVGTSAPDGRVR